ncbi:helix-turn-helix domain-containing protein [Paenibacillus sp. 2TAB23]|uniref:helix-turn-helix domain-containing protein n=1 Tax=Paenibacillus sp. 2TAB23 TaxID=3233004 RepID=UPI003F9B7938
MTEKKRNFFTLPNNIFEVGLTPFQLAVYSYISRCGNNSEAAFPSFSKIAEKTNMGERKAKDVVKELVALGLLIKQRRQSEKGNQSNLYKVVGPTERGGISEPSEGHGRTPQNASGSASDALTLVHDMHKGGAPHAQYKELGINNKKDKENNTSHSHATSHFLKSYDSNIKEEIEDTIIFYYAMYRDRLEKNHPKLKHDQLMRIYE